VNLISLKWIKAKNVLPNLQILIRLTKSLRKKGVSFLRLGKNALVVEGLRKIMPTLIGAAFLMAAKFLSAMAVGRIRRKAVIWHSSTHKLGYDKRTSLVKLNLKEEASLMRRILAGIHRPFVERCQGLPPLRVVGNIWLPHPGSSLVLVSLSKPFR
jgi:hypothetical protein